MDITEIKGQPLSSLVSDLLVCQECRIVDRDHERMRRGYTCPTCGYVSESGMLYFSVNIHILVDLIQESYHSANAEPKVEKLYQSKGAHDISVIIFLCTLRETLLDKLINELLMAQNISEGISEKLLTDNKFHIQILLNYSF